MSERVVEYSEEWRAFLSRKAPYPANAIACAGIYKLRYPGKDSPWCAVKIIERWPTDEDGLQVGDCTWAATVNGMTVAVETVWPYCGRFAISQESYNAMMQQPEVPRAAQEEVMRETRPEFAPPLWQSSEIADLAKALAKAQGDIEGAVKGKANPHFKSTYADLASVWSACRKALSGNGIAVVQMPESTDGATITLITTLTHESGQWMRSRLTMKGQRGGPQDMVSLVTYMRRTALAAMVGVAPVDDDDDGEGASGRDTKPETKPEARSVRDNPAEQEANTFANGLASQLDGCMSVNSLEAILSEAKNAKGIARLKADYPRAYEIVERAEKRRRSYLAKEAA